MESLVFLCSATAASCSLMLVIRRWQDLCSCWYHSQECSSAAVGVTLACTLFLMIRSSDQGLQ